ncbi:hypothetical protein [Amycolatopsis sp. NPDC051903]|uniref:hypothetical protein n=1 Tax=Amycolatopsis sp. NPDC051903 TaxID=3363936 RepID=UPI0037985B60
MTTTAAGGDVADRDEQAQIAALATPAPGEQSWEAIARMRRLSKLIDGIVRRETPRAIVESRAAGVTTEQLVNAWDVTSTWIYKLVPARARKSE